MTKSEAIPDDAPWSVADAKARLSEVIRRAQSNGPQRVTVHGRDVAVVVGIDEFRRIRGERPASSLIELFTRSPHRDIEIAPERGIEAPVRDVEL